MHDSPPRIKETRAGAPLRSSSVGLRVNWPGGRLSVPGLGRLSPRLPRRPRIAAPSAPNRGGAPACGMARTHSHSRSHASNLLGGVSETQLQVPILRPLPGPWFDITSLISTFGEKGACDPMRRRRRLEHLGVLEPRADEHRIPQAHEHVATAVLIAKLADDFGHQLGLVPARMTLRSRLAVNPAPSPAAPETISSTARICSPTARFCIQHERSSTPRPLASTNARASCRSRK